MCGIFGVLDLNGEPSLDAPRFERALRTLDHRGPDAQVVRRVDDGMLLGHTRLSIIDLSDASNQPLVAHDRFWLVFNGEIFNYVELRDELRAAGVVFETSGDAEVLLQAYIHWGERCVTRFNGMWAFAIYDRQRRRLFCSRDRFGEKPFNYAVHDGRFHFASEIKPILAYAPGLAVPDDNVLANFCRTSVGAQHSQTWFRGVVRLQPGHNLTVDTGRIDVRRYWTYPPSHPGQLSFDDARHEYARLFDDAVRVRMRSDVPLGLTLSAGVDSSSIVYTMQACDTAPHHCFTSRFLPDEGLMTDRAIYAGGGSSIDESVSAKRVAAELGLNSHVVDTDYSDFVGQLSRIVWHLESGNSSPAVFPLMQLLAEARRHVTVLLDGQGADELLAGYVANVLWHSVADLLAAGRFSEAIASIAEYRRTYTIGYSVAMLLRGASNRLPWLSTLQQSASGTAAVFGPRLRRFERMRDDPPLPDAAERSWLGSVLRRQHSGGLVNLLHYGDAISMANSMESRMPFLDHRLVDFVWGLPGEHKMRLGVGKRVHREAMRGRVPDRILDNRSKLGFNSPVSAQFRKDGAAGDGPLDVLLSQRCLERELFDRNGLRRIVDMHRQRRRDHGPLLFRLLSTELWFRQFIDAPATVIAALPAGTNSPTPTISSAATIGTTTATAGTGAIASAGAGA